jgi:hypothetical protein
MAVPYTFWSRSLSRTCVLGMTYLSALKLTLDQTEPLVPGSTLDLLTIRPYLPERG